MSKLVNSKRSQEEIVGFVLIILLVTIIALVFLVINIRKPAEKLPSNELESFLQASMRYSTECFITSERRYDLKDLIVSCNDNERCMNNKTSCEMLNETIIRILDESWKPGKDNPVKSYKLRIYENNLTMLRLKNGNCTGMITFSGYNIPVYSGDIITELEICS